MWVDREIRFYWRQMLQRIHQCTECGTMGTMVSWNHDFKWLVIKPLKETKRNLIRITIEELNSFQIIICLQTIVKPTIIEFINLNFSKVLQILLFSEKKNYTLPNLENRKNYKEEKYSESRNSDINIFNLLLNTFPRSILLLDNASM